MSKDRHGSLQLNTQIGPSVRPCERAILRAPSSLLVLVLARYCTFPNGVYCAIRSEAV